MNDLQATVLKIYGKKLVRCKTQGNPHFLFTAYRNIVTQETYYLRTIQLPTFLYISQASTQLITAKYGSLMPKFKIIPIDRQFQIYTYLICSPLNIMPLTSFLQLKKDCGQVLDIDFFLRLVEFTKNSFRVVERQKLPLFNLTQIGITQSGQFVLCDPSFYFSGHQYPQNYENYATWIASFIREIFNLPLNKQEQEQALNQLFGEHFDYIRSLFIYLISQSASLEVTQAKLASAISRNSEDVSTITNSSVDMNELIERNQRESSLMRNTKFKKMGVLGKIIILFVVIGVLSGIGIFCFNFFTRNIQCNEGYFLDNNSQCTTCASGCLRCQSEQMDTCLRCDQNMYLVIEHQQDKEGYCYKQCKGKVIRAFVCLKEPNINQIDKKTAPYSLNKI